MPNNSDIPHESKRLAQQAELGRPEDLRSVNNELQNDLSKLTAKDYGKLLTGIQQQNQADIKANKHLPKLSFYDSGNTGVPDSVKAKYSDGKAVTGYEPEAGPGAGNLH
jgi:hypothetical protein